MLGSVSIDSAHEAPCFPFPFSRILQRREFLHGTAELSSCVKVEVAVLGSPSLIVRTVSRWAKRNATHYFHANERREIIALLSRAFYDFSPLDSARIGVTDRRGVNLQDRNIVKNRDSCIKHIKK